MSGNSDINKRRSRNGYISGNQLANDEMIMVEFKDDNSLLISYEYEAAPYRKR